MKAVIFDFGGTLDTNGVHWSEKFFEAYVSLGIPIKKEEFEQVYRVSEPEVEKYIRENSSFMDVLQKQVGLQIEFLNKTNKLFPFLKKNVVVERISGMCYNDVQSEISRARGVLLSLSSDYKLGVISNFYGNLKNVLKEFNIETFFDAVADSKICGFQKPDPAIFNEVIMMLGENSEDVIIVGDSYSRDIMPSKLLGMRTVWLNVRSWEKPEDTSGADFIIDDLVKLNEVIPQCEQVLK